ncbi:hypothetical protein ACHAQA_007996 [Verticillium albo-atrum]
MSSHTPVELQSSSRNTTSSDLEAGQKDDVRARNPKGGGDEEEARKTTGYARLANVMGQQPDLAIFMRFIDVSAELLLHRQAEIMTLREDLWEYQKKDSQALKGTDRYEYAYDSATLRASQAYRGDSGQWETLMELRTKVKEYQEALAAHRQMVEFRQPHRRQLDSLVQWMEDSARGDISLTGVDSGIWKETDLADLVNMEPSSPDGFTKRWSIQFIHFYDKFIGHHIHTYDEAEHMQNTVVYRNARILAVARTFKTIVACMFPIVAIISLYFIKTLPVRLGVIGAFTLVFALVLDKATSASVKDIFSATAAFSAVLVVFVGTTN